MSIRNFISPNTYTRIDSAEFDKTSKRFTVRVNVTDSNGLPIISYPVSVAGVSACVEITGILSSDEEMSTFIENKCTDKRLVRVSSESIYLPWNNLVISFNTAGELIYDLTSIVFNTTTNSYLERSGENAWALPRIPNCDRFFNQYFSIDKHSNYTDIYNMGYFLLKQLPEFAGTVDE